jgi:rare lipoprotein A
MMTRCAALAIAVAACTSTTPKPTTTTTTTTVPVPSNVQRGYATWYGEAQMTASGERFDKTQLTAAHRSLPFNTLVRVTNEQNGRTVTVRINDRGPYGGHGRIIDLSEAAARVLHMIDAGVVPCQVEVVGKAGR